ncbi:MAG: ribosomal protein S18-alanine N-acetyltransferase [bacterium]|nr:ribosomal protein S18-alanine N-acetyltransferase [bacterium]
MMITINRLKKNDPPQLAELDKRCFAIPWSEKAFEDEVNNKLAHYFIARDGGKIVGYAGFWEVCGEGDITNIAVDAEYRRQHIGSMLIKALIKEAADMNTELLTLEVRRSNIAAQGLYKKYGFKEIGIRKGYYSDNREDALIMARYNADCKKQ